MTTDDRAPDEDAPDGEDAGRAGAGQEPLVAPAAILAALPDAVVAFDDDGRIVYVNAVAEELFGYPPGELPGRPVHVLWPERHRERYTRNMQLYFATEHPLRFSTEVHGLRRDGSEFLGEMSWGVVQADRGRILLAIGRDITERRAAERRVRAVADLGERALAGADPAALAQEAVDLLCRSLPVAGSEVRLADGGALARDGEVGAGALRLPVGAGDEVALDLERELTDAELGFVRAVANTLTTALARLRDEEHYRHQALHDPLTGLANRVLLRDRLEHALARSAREGGETGVIFVDLDDFKRVNDLHGHAAGDEVLIEVGRRLCRAVRPVDTVTRLGGDEFVVVCEQVDESQAGALGERLVGTLRRPFRIDGGVEHGLSASVGVALGRAGADEVLEHADAAVYRAKAEGGGRVVIHRAG